VIANQDSTTAAELTSTPHGFTFWQVFYSLGALAGGIHLFNLTLSATNDYRMLTAIVAILMFLISICMAFRSRPAVYFYVGFALICIAFPTYRLLTEEYDPARIRLLLGGVLMLCGISPFAEELEPRASH
jgi:hypothetical protein